MRLAPACSCWGLFFVGALLTLRSDGTCESAWNKDPVFGVIGVQSGPP
jgi:hypothetical protein